MSDESNGLTDRRNLPHYQPLALNASLRQRGRLARAPVEVLDFNRHGVAVRFGRPLVKEQIVFLSLETGDVRLASVVGVVHNCLCQDGAYRCGIRFRPRSVLQFDADQVEASLARIEALMDMRDAPEAVA